ncbi:MAG: hypothetical protein IPN10_08715 [Saprospiraceae bacterium]|nr:hypothetical protein [Saprospiraceae bacterium]
MIKKLLVGFSALIVLYILGPKVEYEPVTLFETSLGKTGAELENYITEKEKELMILKKIMLPKFIGTTTALNKRQHMSYYIFMVFLPVLRKAKILFWNSEKIWL